MEKSFIAVATLALAIVAGPVLVAQAQTQPEGARRAVPQNRIYNTARPAPKKDPNCDNKLEKDSMAWMEAHHCYDQSR
jgi:hypothetical protein